MHGLPRGYRRGEVSIYATRIMPPRTLGDEEHICERCGIDFTGRRTATHCIDCRSILRRAA